MSYLTTLESLDEFIENTQVDDIQNNDSNIDDNQNDDSNTNNDSNTNINIDVSVFQYQSLFRNRFCSIIQLKYPDKIVQPDKEPNIITDEFNDLLVGVSDYYIFINSTFYSDIVYYHPIFQVLEQANENTKIKMMINSPGGSVSTGCALIDSMKQCKGTIETVCSNFAASMGALVWLNGDILTIHPSAILMLHTIQLFSYGDIRFINEYTSMLEDIAKQEIQLAYDKGVITQEELDEILQGKDLYLKGSVIIDRLNNSKPQKEDNDNE